MTTQATTATVVSPEIAAASDSRVLDIIENMLLECKYNALMTDDLVLTIQEYLKDSSKTNERTLRLLADNAKLRGVFPLAQKIRNSPEFLELVKLNTPDEDIPSNLSAEAFVKGEVVAAGTTAEQLLATVTDTPQDIIAAHEPAKGKKGSAKPKEKLPMPSLKTIAEIEALDRKALIKAVQAVKSNNPDITLRANAASVDLQKLLASELMGVDYTAPQKPAKAGKGNTKAVVKKEDIDLSTLTWEDCRDMSYRQLQQVCGALKLQGLFEGNCGGKGATIEAFMKGIAAYFRSKGVQITEAVMSTTSSPIKPINTPNLDAARANKASREKVSA